MGLIAHSVQFRYLADSADGLAEVGQILGALDHLQRLSADVEADYAPVFHDPAVIKRNKALAEQLIDEHRIGARIKRWWTNAEAAFDAPRAVKTIVSSKSAVCMRDFDSPEEWANLAVAALAGVADDDYPRVCIHVWPEKWNTIRLSLYLCRDDKSSLVIEGSLSSTDAYEDHALRVPMEECLAKLEQTGRFAQR